MQIGDSTKTIVVRENYIDPSKLNVYSSGIVSESNPAYIIETYSSGASWYRVWSDGWIEQGYSTTAVSGIWTFSKPFTNTDYICQFSLYRVSSSSSGWNFHIFYSSKTATAIGFNNSDNSLCMFYACGY